MYRMCNRYYNQSAADENNLLAGGKLLETSTSDKLIKTFLMYENKLI